MTGLCDECQRRPALVRLVRLDSLGAARGPYGSFCRECLAGVAAWLPEIPRSSAWFGEVDAEDCCLN